MDLTDPVNQNCSHLLVDVRLMHHVVGRSPEVVLGSAKVLHDGDTVLGHHLRVLLVSSVHFVDVLGLDLILHNRVEMVELPANLTVFLSLDILG